jgi:hypothetical protein
MTRHMQLVARRYLGLSVWGLGTLLSAWSWTLHNASYSGALDDLLLKGTDDRVVDLTNACQWAEWFYLLDTLLYIACYVGFSALIACQLRHCLQADIATVAEGPALRPLLVRKFVTTCLPLALLLIVSLALADLAENLSALKQLLAYPHAPSLHAAAIFRVATAVKSGLLVALALWLAAGVLLWLTGGAIPLQAHERNARRAVREGIMDVLARTRYCLLTVLLYAALMLGIDQAQDVLTGLAGFTRARFVVALSLLFAVALGMFALHTHSHAVWVWSRLLVRLRTRRQSNSAANEPIATFSKWWGRFLGASPWFIVLTLCVRTAGTAGQQVSELSTAWLLLGAGAFSTAWGVGFILWKEREGRLGVRAGQPYYNSEADEATLLRDKAYQFLGFIKPSPLWIPLVAVLGILLVRGLYVFEITPAACHALAAISFGFALWTSIVNRLALNSLRTRFPWILSLFVIVAMLAAFDLTQNHTMLAGEGSASTSHGETTLKHMYWLTLCLSLGLMAAYALWLWSRYKWLLGRRLFVTALLLVAWVGTTLYVGSRGDARGVVANSISPDQRKTLREAVRDWLIHKDDACTENGCASIRVYLVSAEGGGIRAAYYSARLLSQLSKMTKEPAAEPTLDMHGRVFSLSGVSGGSLGVMTWRLCPRGFGHDNCVSELGSRDLLTPLASAWMYEDALALVLPTGRCTLPGCGFIDRGSWFERSLERSLDAYSDPLPLTPPYVFLNSTWVETGERAIASNIRIENEACVELRHKAVDTRTVHRADFDACPRDFPTARDQLLEIGATTRASTLAHNSARFPYFNPIGYIVGRGHLADGGYFDNSGTQTTNDILSEIVHQLTCKGEGEDCPLRARQERLTAKVAITAIMIRNGVRNNSDPSESSCEVPRPRPPQGILSNAAGPPITALNATGIGTPNRVAQCNLRRAMTNLVEPLARQKSEGGYLDVRLVSGDTVYPLGWYLSPVAQRGIDDAVERCLKTEGLADELETPTHRRREDTPGQPLSCWAWAQ